MHGYVLIVTITTFWWRRRKPTWWRNNLKGVSLGFSLFERQVPQIICGIRGQKSLRTCAHDFQLFALFFLITTPLVFFFKKVDSKAPAAVPWLESSGKIRQRGRDRARQLMRAVSAELRVDCFQPPN